MPWRRLPTGASLDNDRARDSGRGGSERLAAANVFEHSDALVQEAEELGAAGRPQGAVGELRRVAARLAVDDE